MLIVRRLTVLAAAVFFYSCASAPQTASPPPEAPAQAAEPARESAPAQSGARQRAQDLITGGAAQGGSGGGTQAANPAPAQPGSAAPTAPVTTQSPPGEEAAAELTAREKQFFENYLRRLKYMMVVKDGSTANDFQKRTIITKGNEHLLRQGYDVVQYDQLMKNIEDQRTAYEAEVGSSMSLTQYIAQKLGADVYVELDVAPRSSTESSRHFGEANFTANMFDPSTAELIGSVTYRTDRSVSTSSQEDALLNALSAGTAQLMPRIIRDSTNVLRNRYSNGIRYQVIVQRTPDSRAVAAFRRNLRSRVREIVMGPGAADQTTMDVYLFGSISDLEDACYAAFERTPGMENAYWVYTRGKTLTFNTGG